MRPTFQKHGYVCNTFARLNQLASLGDLRGGEFLLPAKPNTTAAIMSHLTGL